MLILLLAVLVAIIIVSVPRWPWSREWGYFPSVGIAVLLVAVTILSLLNVL